MKKLLITLAMAAAFTAGAQTRHENRYNESYRHQPAPVEDDFAGTDMAADANSVLFSDLPDYQKPIQAIITDANGEIITQKRISITNNTMDVHRLPKGELYFVTLMYKNKSRKAFVLHR